MTDTWLNQGGDASMATVASREISITISFRQLTLTASSRGGASTVPAWSGKF